MNNPRPRLYSTKHPRPRINELKKISLTKCRDTKQISGKIEISSFAENAEKSETARWIRKQKNIGLRDMAKICRRDFEN